MNIFQVEGPETLKGWGKVFSTLLGEKREFWDLISIFRAKRQAPLPWTFEQFSHKSLEKNTKAVVWVNMWDRRWLKTSYSIWKVSLLPTFWSHSHLAAVPSGSQWFSNIVRFELCVMFQRLKSADCEGSGGSCWLIFFFLKWPWLMINIWCHVFFYIAKGNLSTLILSPASSKQICSIYLCIMVYRRQSHSNSTPPYLTCLKHTIDKSMVKSLRDEIIA